MSDVKTRLELLEQRVKELEYANKLLSEGVVAGILCIMPRAELWAWVQQEAAKAKGDE